MAVVEPPPLPSEPVVSNVLMGVTPPSRTRMKSDRVARKTTVKLSLVAAASLSM